LCSSSSPSGTAAGHIAVGARGVSGFAGTTLSSPDPLTLTIRKGDALGAGYHSPADISITSTGVAGSRLRAILSNLRRLDWQLWRDMLVSSGSQIVVNGRALAPGGPGLNIVVLDAQTGALRSSTHTDIGRTLGINEIVVYDVGP